VLPSHLIPDRWTVLPELPLGPNGKLIERLLPVPGGQPQAAAEPPATPTEQRLHALWCAELQVPAIGRDDSFMDNGGNSLTAVRVLGRVREEFGHQLPLVDFLGQPSIRAMARMVDERLAARSGG